VAFGGNGRIGVRVGATAPEPLAPQRHGQLLVRIKITLPARFIPDPAIRQRNGDVNTIAPFKVCGATCDSVDILSRPFWLPETVDTGDWIEIGHIGAYSMALRTRFNGFYPDTFIEVSTPFEEGEAPQGFASLETMAV
jgi:ornithine decarboxylase